ncbi:MULTISPECIES: hypothetical protein [unclassified Mycobacterium]|uniref:hypothetical protein n=1 Tax=unclassified Mycobacterium TaxID=2642494 RepID=UPI0007FD9252|nr:MULTISPECIES: hypothetical protein [unclassified Mycobacterium]OBG71330.1 hypothetical protein A5700_12220 [Mycobacterium sp. E1214]OBH28698.1 hypothetical protein A5693_21535 [Mycobacterium sp. E1319]
MSIESEILAQMLTDAGVDVEVDKLAHQIAGEIKELSPVFGETGHDEKRSAPPHGSPGDYRDATKVILHPTKPHARRVINDDYKAVWIELGSRHMPEYAPFAKAAALHGGTGPDFAEGVERAQQNLRGEVEKLTKLMAEGAAAHEITAQRGRVNQARQARSAAFNAARPRRRGRRR